MKAHGLLREKCCPICLETESFEIELRVPSLHGGMRRLTVVISDKGILDQGEALAANIVHEDLWVYTEPDGYARCLSCNKDFTVGELVPEKRSLLVSAG